MLTNKTCRKANISHKESKIVMLNDLFFWSKCVNDFYFKIFKIMTDYIHRYNRCLQSIRKSSSLFALSSRLNRVGLRRRDLALLSRSIRCAIWKESVFYYLNKCSFSLKVQGSHFLGDLLFFFLHEHVSMFEPCWERFMRNIDWDKQDQTQEEIVSEACPTS